MFHVWLKRISTVALPAPTLSLGLRPAQVYTVTACTDPLSQRQCQENHIYLGAHWADRVGGTIDLRY